MFSVLFSVWVIVSTGSRVSCAGWALCPPAKFAAAAPTSSSTNWPRPHISNIRRVGSEHRRGVTSCTQNGIRRCLPQESATELKQSCHYRFWERLLSDFCFFALFEVTGWMWKHTGSSGFSRKAPTLSGTDFMLIKHQFNVRKSWNSAQPWVKQKDLKDSYADFLFFIMHFDPEQLILRTLLCRNITETWTMLTHQLQDVIYSF